MPGGGEAVRRLFQWVKVSFKNSAEKVEQTQLRVSKGFYMKACGDVETGKSQSVKMRMIAKANSGGDTNEAIGSN